MAFFSLFSRHVILLLIVACVILLPGLFASHPVDRDEPRYAQASKQMLESGDLVDIRFQDEPRYKKPIGVYWLQAGTVWLGEHIGFSQARMTIGMYRLPSFAAALGVVILTFWFGASLLGTLSGFLGALFLLGMGIFAIEARLATTDMLLTLGTLMALIPLGRVYIHPLRKVQLWDFFLFWGGLAFGILIKGPMILLVVGLCVLTLACKERSFLFLRNLCPLRGVLFLGACIAPWFIAIGVRSGGAFFAQSLGTDMGQKILHGMESHGAPPGTYLLLAPFILGPCWVFFILSLRTIAHSRHERAITFLLAWLIPSWLVFEAIPTKLPHYILPLAPGLSLLTAWALCQPMVGLPWGRVKKSLGVLFLGGIPCFMVAAILLGTATLGGGMSWMAWALLGVTLLLMAVGVIQVWRGALFQGSWPSVAAASLLCFTFFGFIQPTWTSLHLSQRIVARTQDMARHAPLDSCSFITRAVVGYGEPSLIFLGGKDLILTMPEGAADMLSRLPCTIVMVEGQKLPEFQQALLERNSVKQVQDGPVRGFNFGKGRFVELYFFS